MKNYWWPIHSYTCLPQDKDLLSWSLRPGPFTAQFTADQGSDTLGYLRFLNTICSAFLLYPLLLYQ